MNERLRDPALRPTPYPTIFSRYQRIRIVNLPARTDRRAEMEAQIAALGLNDHPDLAFVDGVVMAERGPFKRPGSHGAFVVHRDILRMAMADNVSVLILQDDCQFLPDISTYQPVACDIFYGGYRARDPHNLHDSEIIGAHFMGFTPRAIAKAVAYLDRYLVPGFPPDASAVAKGEYDGQHLPPIDGAFVWFRRAHPELTTVFAMLSQQRASRTDIGDQRWFDRVPGLRDLAEVARIIVR